MKLLRITTGGQDKRNSDIWLRIINVAITILFPLCICLQLIIQHLSK